MFRESQIMSQLCQLLLLWPIKSYRSSPQTAVLLFSCQFVSNCLWPHELQASLSSTISLSLFKFMSIESVMLSNCLILCCSLLLLPSIFPSIRVFSNKLALCIRWPKCWKFSFGLSPSNEYSGLIFFRMDWFGLIVVQGTPNSLLQHQLESINSSVLSLLYGPTLTPVHDYWKNHSLDCMDLCQQNSV